MRFSWLVLGAGALLAAAIAGISYGRLEARVGLLTPDDPDVTGLGKDIYAQQCAACHGADLRGEPNWQTPRADGLMPAPPHDRTGHTWHHPDEQLFAITKFGTAAVVGNGYQSNMKGYGGILSDDEIIAVLSYLKSTWPDDVRAVHDERNAAYEAGR